ncbi:hypothetical protein [Ornithinimicrobium murale]|uniref:hypothetical protein n=1 Tax=Ornithinimicrobium murale TaxID=1050153 RepID=UPI000E0D733E|nr:hypothetical protein [Ornithinimicrobium murale]
MSRNLVVPYRVECNGDGRWPCPAFHESSSVSTLAETRSDAKAEGWEVNVKNPAGRRRLDFCPRHSTNIQEPEPVDLLGALINSFKDRTP